MSTDEGYIFDLEVETDPGVAAGWLHVSSGTDEEDHSRIEDYVRQVGAHVYESLPLHLEAWQGMNHRQSMAPSFEACLEELAGAE